MRFFTLVEKLLNEKKYKHTLWIDPKGKIIDISNTNYTHFSWLAKTLSVSDKNDIYSEAAKLGWIQVRNHTSMTSLGSSVDFTGSKKAMKKHKKIIFGIIDETLFDGKTSQFLVAFSFLDDDGNYVGDRHNFVMPGNDSKLRRYL